MSSAISPSQRTDSRLIAGTNRGTEALRTGTAQGLPEDDLSLHLLQRRIEGRALVVPPYPSDVAAVEACAQAPSPQIPSRSQQSLPPRKRGASTSSKMAPSQAGPNDALRSAIETDLRTSQGNSQEVPRMEDTGRGLQGKDDGKSRSSDGGHRCAQIKLRAPPFKPYVGERPSQR